MARRVDIAAGKLIRRLRVRAGLSMVELADKAGVTYQQIAKYEKGTNRVTISKLFDICSVLGVSPAEFISILIYRLKI